MATAETEGEAGCAAMGYGGGAAAGGLRRAGVRSGARGATSVARGGLFKNKFPGHAVGAPIQEFSAAQAGRSTFSRKLNYVVTENGSLRLGRINNNAIGGGHIDLAGGAPVRAAGEVTIVRGQIKTINNASGHYQPSGAGAQAAAEEAFGSAGFDVAGKYVELPF